VSEASSKGASREATTAVANDKAQGIERFRRDTRTGIEIPLKGVDATRDPYIGPHDEVGYRDKNGVEHIIDRGHRAQPTVSSPARGIVGSEFRALKMTNLVTPRQQMTLETLMNGPRYKSMDAGDKGDAVRAVLQGR